MPTDRQKLFLEGPIGLALLQLAIPIILGNILQTGYQLTDAFWVGRLGAAAVAAVSISFPVSFLVIALGAGFGIAGAPQVIWWRPICSIFWRSRPMSMPVRSVSCGCPLSASSSYSSTRCFRR